MENSQMIALEIRILLSLIISSVLFGYNIQIDVAFNFF